MNEVLKKAIRKIRARAGDHGTKTAHGMHYVDGLRAAANMLEQLARKEPAAAPREPAPDERVQHGEWGPMPDAGTYADEPFIPFYQLLQSPDVWADIDQQTFTELKGVNCRILYGVKP